MKFTDLDDLEAKKSELSAIVIAWGDQQEAAENCNKKDNQSECKQY